MAETGEPYAAARREVIREHQGASRSPLPGSKMLLWINGPCGVGPARVKENWLRIQRSEKGS